MLLQAEIDLLKNLHHDNIVKYIGFVKSQDCLNIILESVITIHHWGY